MDESNVPSPGLNFQLSPENSPETNMNQMDTSVELSGLKTNADSRSSQQFCLRWNNHTVSSIAFLKNDRFGIVFLFDETIVLPFASQTAFRPRFQ